MNQSSATRDLCRHFLSLNRYSFYEQRVMMKSLIGLLIQVVRV